MSITSEEAIDVVNEVFGRHPGYRALHAKGTLCKGTFTATPVAGELTRAAHMQGEPVPVSIHDFVTAAGKAIPYGIYDVERNVGWVNVGKITRRPPSRSKVCAAGGVGTGWWPTPMSTSS